MKDKLRKYTVLALLAAGFALQGTANANLIDNGTYLTDTSFGLDWLNLTATAGLSMNQVLSSNQYIGWHYATVDQYIQLIYDITGNAIPTSVNNLSLSPINITTVNLTHLQATQVIQEIGNTWDLYYQQKYGVSSADLYLAEQGAVGVHMDWTFGMLQPIYNSIYFGQIIDYNPDQTNPSNVITNAGVAETSYSKDTSLVYVGSFLIRNSVSTVPVPSSIIMFISALLCFLLVNLITLRKTL